jgi:DNA-binding NarL/FixJ family response regulator
MGELRVGVVEDQPLYRDMVVALLRAQPGVEVPLVASGASEARAAFQPDCIDVAVLDVHLEDGNGLALGVSLRRRDPGLGILLLSSHDVMELLLDLPPDVRDGWSYLSKNSGTSAEVLVRALESTAAGHTVIDPELAAKAFRREGSSLAELTTRQYEVLQLVASGLSNAGIAERLGLSERSIENHINAIYSLLGLPRDRNQRVSAVLRFIEETSRLDA